MAPMPWTTRGYATRHDLVSTRSVNGQRLPASALGNPRGLFTETFGLGTSEVPAIALVRTVEEGQQRLADVLTPATNTAPRQLGMNAAG